MHAPGKSLFRRVDASGTRGVVSAP